MENSLENVFNKAKESKRKRTTHFHPRNFQNVLCIYTSFSLSWCKKTEETNNVFMKNNYKNYSTKTIQLLEMLLQKS